MSVAGTKAAIVEMLESTLEHGILHEAKYNVTCDFGNLKHSCVGSELTKGLFWGYVYGEGAFGLLRLQ